MQVAFRSTSPDDPVVRRVLDAYFGELAARFGLERPVVQVDAAEVAAGRGAFLVLYVDGSPHGCGAVRTIEPGVGEIKRMWVAPTMRGHGLGRRLLAALEDASRGLGHHEVRLDTNSHLAEAVGLYRSSGYREVPDYNDNTDADCWFVKDLKSVSPDPTRLFSGRGSG